jgi:hypothetical protein
VGAREVACVPGVDGLGSAGAVQQWPAQTRPVAQEPARIVKETGIKLE